MVVCVCIKRDNGGVWNAFRNSKALPKQKVSYCAVIYLHFFTDMLCINEDLSPLTSIKFQLKEIRLSLFKLSLNCDNILM